MKGSEEIVIPFVVMFFIALFLSPMNLLAYEHNHIYFSLTRIYSALIMASNMMWGHQIIIYLIYGTVNWVLLLGGAILSFIFFLLLRSQFGIASNQWLRSMISHHSTALSTTNALLKDPNNFKNDPKLYRLAKDIVYNQEREILFMKSYLA